MESINTSKAKLEQQSSRSQRRKLSFIITCTVIFSLIIGSIITVITILKQEAQAEAANPSTVIRAVCSMNWKYRSCYESLSNQMSINPSETMNPSKIFILSLKSTMKELKGLISVSDMKDSKKLPVLKDCGTLLINSMRLINKTLMEVMDQTDLDENIFKKKKNKSMISSGILQNWMTNATENLDNCSKRIENRTNGGEWIELMKVKMKMDRHVRPSMETSLMILVRNDEIVEMFDPRFASVLGDLLSPDGYITVAVFFCPQYFVLVFLIVLVLRLY